MTAFDDATAAQRAAAMRSERESQRALTEAYRIIQRALRADLDALTAALAEAQAAGVEITPAILGRGRAAIPNVQALKGETYAEAAERVRQRYLALASQTEAELARYGRYAETVIANGQRQAALAALSTSEAVMTAALGTPPPGVSVAFNRLPTGAIEALVGNLGDGRPLGALLDGLGVEASAAGRKALIEALGKGLSPRQAARAFREGTGVSAARALRVNRQELNRSFRDAGLENLRLNREVCDGWTWAASGSRRTCAACYAKHGTFHKLDEPFQSHVCCRCSCVPHTKSWAELGFGDIPDTRPQLPDRDTLFGKLTEAEQRSILGSRAFDLWQAGEIALEDFATPTHSRVWGGGIRQTRLYELARIGAQEAAD